MLVCLTSTFCRTLVRLYYISFISTAYQLFLRYLVVLFGYSNNSYDIILCSFRIFLPHISFTTLSEKELNKQNHFRRWDKQRNTCCLSFSILKQSLLVISKSNTTYQKYSFQNDKNTKAKTFKNEVFHSYNHVVNNCIVFLDVKTQIRNRTRKNQKQK